MVFAAFTGATAQVQVISRFNSTNGSDPNAGLIADQQRNLYGATADGGEYGIGGAIASPAQNFKTLVIFNGTNGEDPFAPLVQGTDGNFYSTTVYGGDRNFGTVFKINPRGKLTTLYSFCAQTSCADGTYPDGLTQATDGNFYGATYGGSQSQGTVFKITPEGTLTTLYTFCTKTNCTDGAQPQSVLFQGTDGDFYGTTNFGGRNGQGTIFKISPSGKLTTLYRFCAKTNCTDGAQPYTGLIQAGDGNFYGTTALGGGNQSCRGGCGAAYKITPKGKLTTLYSFCMQTNCSDGSTPQGRLVQGTDGNFYGTTDVGGANNFGTVFKITPAGKLTTLHSFCTTTCTDGGIPYAGLVQATDGNFYGTAAFGGQNGYGAVFKMTAAGKVTTLHGLDKTDGFSPGAELMQATDGSFYGSTQEGGDLNCSSGGCGTVFRVDEGLGQFVETRPTSGKVGAKVIILGTNLTGATSVSFNGTAARFHVVSKSEIKATVPAGATAGKLQVKTSHGTLVSNVDFRVTH
jgi:uncharacterized repeat protein (TIGR03803 family)